MKIKSYLLIFILIISSGIFNSFSQVMVIKTLEGTVVTKNVSTIKNMTFVSNSLNINLLNNPSEKFNLSKVSKIYFKSSAVSTGKNFSQTSTTFVIYPNPAQNVIKIKNLGFENTEICIYSLEGCKILQSVVSVNNATTDISCLDPGLYFVVINGKSHKFIKL